MFVIVGPQHLGGGGDARGALDDVDDTLDLIKRRREPRREERRQHADRLASYRT